MKTLLVSVFRIRFNVDESRHTIRYAKDAMFFNKDIDNGNMQAVVANDMEEAVKMLRKDVRMMLAKHLGKDPLFNFNDFTFEVAYSEIVDNHVWLTPEWTNCWFSAAGDIL